MSLRAHFFDGFVDWWLSGVRVYCSRDRLFDRFMFSGFTAREKATVYMLVSRFIGDH